MRCLNIVILFIFFIVSSCGSLIKPTDIGKERTQQLDWNIVLLDSTGLIFLFIPAIAPNALGFIGAGFGAFISIASLVFDYINGTLFIKKVQFDKY
jgi:hypothetical protein